MLCYVYSLDYAARISDYCLWLFELNLNVLFFLNGFMQWISIVVHMAVLLEFYSRTINLKEGSFLGDSSILWLFRFCWCIMLFWVLKYFKIYLLTASCKVIWPIKSLRRRLKLSVKNVVKFLGYTGNSKSCDFPITKQRSLVYVLISLSLSFPRSWMIDHQYWRQRARVSTGNHSKMLVLLFIQNLHSPISIWF